MTAPLFTALNESLARTYATLVLTHQAHWNVVGDDFFQLHEAYGEQYQALLESADALAERIRQLGGFPSISAPLATQLKSVPDKPAVKDVIRSNLETRYKLVLARNVQGIDPETQNLVIERITMHDKFLWMLQSFASAED